MGDLEFYIYISHIFPMPYYLIFHFKILINQKLILALN